MLFQNGVIVFQVLSQFLTVEPHGAHHIAALARQAVDGKARRVSPAMFLRIHQLNQIKPHLARGTQYSSGDSTHGHLPDFFVYCIQCSETHKLFRRDSAQFVAFPVGIVSRILYSKNK